MLPYDPATPLLGIPWFFLRLRCNWEGLLTLIRASHCPQHRWEWGRGSESRRRAPPSGSGKHHEEMTYSSCPGASLWPYQRWGRDKSPGCRHDFRNTDLCPKVGFDNHCPLGHWEIWAGTSMSEPRLRSYCFWGLWAACCTTQKVYGGPLPSLTFLWKGSGEGPMERVRRVLQMLIGGWGWEVSGVWSIYPGRCIMETN